MKSFRNNFNLQKALLKANKTEHKQVKRSKLSEVSSVLVLIGIVFLLVCVPLLLQAIVGVIRGL